MSATPLRAALSISALLGALGATQVAAQSPGDGLRADFPELAGLFDAFDVTQGAMYEQLVEIGQSGDAGDAEDRLRQALMMQANMTMAQMMQMGPAAAMPGMMMGPFGELETGAMSVLTEVIGGTHAPADARDAFSSSAPLTQQAASVLRRGREFEARIFDIYVDVSISDKSEAINGAVDDYLSDARSSVAPQAKDPALMYGHPFAAAFRTGYPRVSGLYWASQWLQLASLEPLMSGGGGDSVEDDVDTTIERFEAKLAGMGGMSMLPSEIPMVPAISPLLLSRHPQAAWIIDNLNVLEVVIADLLAHPDVEDRAGSIDAMVTEFMNRGSNLAVDRDYLLSALRTGIFNQGGPALGELARSERNRTRAEMEMGGHVVLPGMN